MDDTGIDPFAKQEVYIAGQLRDRMMPRALLQFFKPENYLEVRRVLEKAARQDLIGNGCDVLIPAIPPREAIEARRRRANDGVRGDHAQTCRREPLSGRIGAASTLGNRARVTRAAENSAW